MNDAFNDFKIEPSSGHANALKLSGGVWKRLIMYHISEGYTVRVWNNQNDRKWTPILMKSTQKWVNGAIRKGHDRFTNNCIVMFPIRRKWTSILILMGQFLILLMKIEKHLTKLLSPLTEINLLFNSWYVAWSLCHHSSPVPCAMATLNVITVVNLCFICQVQSGRWEIVFKHMFRSLDIEYVCHIAKW